MSARPSAAARAHPARRAQGQGRRPRSRCAARFSHQGSRLEQVPDPLVWLQRADRHEQHGLAVEAELGAQECPGCRIGLEESGVDPVAMCLDSSGLYSGDTQIELALGQDTVITAPQMRRAVAKSSQRRIAWRQPGSVSTMLWIVETAGLLRSASPRSARRCWSSASGYAPGRCARGAGRAPAGSAAVDRTGCAGAGRVPARQPRGLRRPADCHPRRSGGPVARRRRVPAGRLPATPPGPRRRRSRACRSG